MTYEHRYEIHREGTGSRVTYRLRQIDIQNPPWRMRLLLMRSLSHRIMMPLLCRRGFTNLLRSAKRRRAPTGATPTPKLNAP